MQLFQPPSEQSLEFLKPYRVADELFTLPSGEQIPITKYFLTFKPWTGSPIPNDYNGKAVIDWNSEPVFAELAVLRLFQANGWSGVWVDSYRRTFRTGLPDVAAPVPLPAAQQEVISAIKQKTGRSGGCWDVLVWRDDQMLFWELKRQKKDRLQSSQREWLANALRCGLLSSNFGIIEWSILGFQNIGNEIYLK